jgi:hypothetical protein
MSPVLDAVGGRSYTQAIQTPGALGGRRGRETWYKEDILPLSQERMGHTPRVYGSPWRPVQVSARVRVAALTATIEIVFETRTLGGIPTTILQAKLEILPNTLEAVGGIILPGFIIPVGLLVIVYLRDSTGTEARDLTVEMEYLVRAVGQ